MIDLQLQLALDRFFTTHTYYPCCLLIHLDVAYLQQVSSALLSQYHWTTLSFGSLISEALLKVVPARRSSDILNATRTAVQQRAPGTMLCTDIDILFSPALAIDPLRVLRETSRIAPLIVMWPGSSSAGAVAYATREHAHYRNWHSPELSNACIISL